MFSALAAFNTRIGDLGTNIENKIVERITNSVNETVIRTVDKKIKEIGNMQENFMTEINKLNDVRVTKTIRLPASEGVCVIKYSNICECFSPSETTHPIECCGDKIIRLEWTGATILYEQINDTSCTPSKGNSSCLVNEENNFKVNYEDKLNIYNSCSGKKRCNVTVNPSRNIKIQIPVFCVPATRIYNFIGDSPTNVTKISPIFYIAGNDYIGKEINYSCTVKAAEVLKLKVFYIYLGPRSCEKVKMYSKGFPKFELVCTDFGMTMFYKDIGRIGTEFSLEIKDLKLDRNEVIYLRFGRVANINVRCHGYQIDTTETVNMLNTTENSKMVCKDEDETSPYVMFGVIVAALIVTNLACIVIGIYCFLRNRKSPKETTTNVTMSNREENESDNSHYQYVDIRNSHVTYSNHNNHDLEIEDQESDNGFISVRV
ncbi:hypothetical protein LOTGIDRAFT_175456 [Lottia gigantea]|uniref:Uncharacterized protein n=1 Tax=Lottia gigantea TaxID=225164 RepID=V4ALE6_LOTGI|nr:hypothetical protein LOTGIDRAFT_175456 [Lottia gigantea]ESO94401.1 hypothetical protein LOTGIDRAFT_175456 [Lottia gigantea]